MKIACPTCGKDNEINREAAESATGGLLDLSCEHCSAILPAVGAQQVLDELRNELENEVGSIFAEEPQREVSHSTLMIGEKPGEAEPTSSSPGFPAYQVVDTGGEKHSGPAPETASSQPPVSVESAPKGDENDEPTWVPAASGLDSLIAEEFDSARKRQHDDAHDDLLKPPDIKPRPKRLEPVPPPAFDGDFSGLVPVDSGAAGGGTRPRPANRTSSMIGDSLTTIETTPRRLSNMLLALLVLGVIVVVGLLSVILILLLRERPETTAVAARQVVAPADPQADPGGPFGDPARDPSVDPGRGPATAIDAGTAAISDAAAAVARRPDAGKPDRGQANVLARGPDPRPKQPRADPVVRKPPREKQPSEARPKPDPDPVVEDKEPPPKRRSGKRPAGCDSVLFPDPLDCPAGGPPGKQQILSVVRDHLGEIDACAKKQHAVDPSKASGKIVMRFYIRSTGRTSKVSVVSPEFKGSLVGSCIQGKIGKWHFGAWDGSRIGPINFPFKLKTN